MIKKNRHVARHTWWQRAIQISGIPFISSCISRAFVRLEKWCKWIEHPDGPSHWRLWKQFILCSLGLVLFLSGSFISFVSIAVAITQSIYEIPIPVLWPYLVNGYVGGTLLFLGVSLWIIGKHPSRIEFKISEDTENLDTVLSDVRSKIDRLDRTAHTEARQQIRRLNKLRFMKANVSVIKITALRTLQVETYKDEELIALLNSALDQLRYYTGDKEDESYKKYAGDVKKAIKRYRAALESESSSDNPMSSKELRRYLILLREEIDEYKHRYGYGEAIIESVVYWSLFSGVALAVIGLSPLLHEPYFQGSLTVIHWAIFGLVGAIVATVNNISKKDTYRIAEDEGNLVLKSMMHGCFLGVITSILFYLAILGDILDGKIFPELSLCPVECKATVKDNALSVIWAIASGFTGGRWLEGLVKRMDSSTHASQRDAA